MEFTEEKPLRNRYQHPFPKAGFITASATLSDGRVLASEAILGESRLNNLIVNRASVLVAAACMGVAAITHMAIGTGATPEAGGDTLLSAEAGRVPVAITFFDLANVEGDTEVYPSSGPSMSGKIQIQGTFGPSVSGALKELALFGGTGAGAANGGLMLNRRTFTPWEKPANSSVIYTWILVF